MEFWSAGSILAEVRRRGISLRRLSLDCGLKEHSLASALQKPNSKYEAVISQFLGVPAHELWPSRYLASGQRRRPQPKKNYHPARRFKARMPAEQAK